MVEGDFTADAQVVEGSAELVPIAEAPPVPAPGPPPPTLFHTDDPSEVVERASKVADAPMLGVTSVLDWTRKIGDEETGGWEARVEARSLDGRVLGAAEAQCLRSERTWKSRDDYALRSMAQTRATSKALRSVLAFVVTLAGYDPTPAEEMPPDPRTEFASPPERRLIFERGRAKGMPDEALQDLLGKVGGTHTTAQLPQSHVNDVLAAIDAWKPPS